MQTIEETKDHRIVEHGGKTYVLPKRAAVEVKEGDPGEGVQVTISHNLISANGFESITDCLYDIKKVFTYLVIAVSCCGIAYIISLIGG